MASTRTQNFMTGLFLATLLALAPVVLAQSATPVSTVTQSESLHQAQEFVKKKYSIKGSWMLTERDGKSYISFSSDFKTKNGPDLKIFLSPMTVEDVTGDTAVAGSLRLGHLKNHKGWQEYEIPAGTDLLNYQSVLIHCEAYAVLWGGGNL